MATALHSVVRVKPFCALAAPADRKIRPGRRRYASEGPIGDGCPVGCVGFDASGGVDFEERTAIVQFLVSRKLSDAEVGTNCISGPNLSTFADTATK